MGVNTVLRIAYSNKNFKNMENLFTYLFNINLSTIGTGSPLIWCHFTTLSSLVLYCNKINFQTKPGKSGRGRLARWKNIRFVIFCSRGPRFDPRRGNLFRRDFFAMYVWRWPNNRTGSSIHATSIGKLLRQSLYWVKRNVASINRPYDELDRWCHISYYATLQQKLL